MKKYSKTTKKDQARMTIFTNIIPTIDIIQKGTIIQLFQNRQIL